MDVAELEATARRIVAPGKGILAADESTGTMGKRLKSVGVENTEANRLAFRETLFTAAGWHRHVSGVILYDETLRQTASNGVPVPKLLADQGVIPGIKVDKGTKPLTGAPEELATEGLDGLADRCREYRGLGARFAKWRAVVAIGPGMPSGLALRANAHALARYAAICQENGLVPIVEPEVLMDGDHDAATTFDATSRALHAVFGELVRQRVHVEGMLLKPNMVVSGEKAASPAGVKDVAALTIRCFRRHVPAAVPGVVFLSGGQSDAIATEHLDAMNKMGPHPWTLSFSYGRALQASALKAWAGKAGNRAAAQRVFLKRAKLNGLAAEGKYSADMEQDDA